MRLNKFLARGLGISRRTADIYIKAGKVTVNGSIPEIFVDIGAKDEVRYDGQKVVLSPYTYLLLNKPVGYVCSRHRQGSNPTVYDLIPEKYHGLKTVGRLDKDSSGLIMFTDDGDLAFQLTHPKFQKPKQYLVTTDRTLTKEDIASVNRGVSLPEGISHMSLKLTSQNNQSAILMKEGRNRQIRRTLELLGYHVVALQRIEFGAVRLDDLPSGQWRIAQDQEIALSLRLLTTPSAEAV